MKICFILPQTLRKPIGGYKIIYEYANRLVDEGHKVVILFLNERALERFRLPKVIRGYAVEIFTQIEPRWFKFKPEILKISSTDRRVNKKIESTDLAIATGVDTVEATCRLFAGVRKAYFIQGYETWLYSANQINKTFSLGMDNIVISKWLKEIVDQYGKRPALLLPNPIDTNVYRIITPIEERNKYFIGVLYHGAEHKGFKYAFKAIKKIKEKIPELKLYMFGTSIPDFLMPDWVEFIFNATQEETIKIYNNVSAFVCATIAEGYGLTGLEAMACGAALVSTEYEGVKEYAENNYNALLSPIRDVDALADNLERIMQDEKLRLRIVKNGMSTVKDFSWEKAINILSDYLES